MSTSERTLPWLARLAWIAVAWVGGEAIDAATAGRSDALAQTATWSAAAAWLAGVAALAVPAGVTLTAARTVTPLAVPAAITSWIAGGGAWAAAFAGASVLTTFVVFTPEFGRASVQASAYGEEDRHLLRPPPAYALASVLVWAIWAAALIAAPLALAARMWLLGSVAATVAIALGAFAWPRWHRLSRRWFVIVPVGVVVHDHLVLAETLLLRRQELASIRLAPADTDAADFTGPAGGHALEIVTSESVTAIRAGTPRDPRGTALHLTACLIAPTRPGRALAAVAARRLPVG